METVYNLAQLKSKVLHALHKNIEPPLNRQVALEAKRALDVKNLINKEISFVNEGMSFFVISKNVMGAVFENLSIKDSPLDYLQSDLDEYEVEEGKKIIFSDFDEFVRFQRKDKPRQKEIRKKQKEEKKLNKEISRFLKSKNTVESILNNIKMESSFLSLDFECFFYDNSKVMEVGLSYFTINGEKENAHWLVEDNLKLFKKQPNKFSKQNQFKMGETQIKGLEKIKKELGLYLNKIDFVVCHASAMEKRVLKNMGFSFDNFQFIDAQIMYKHYAKSKQVSSLKKIIDEMNISDKKGEVFHNAGNDAFLTSVYFLEILKDKKPELFLDDVSKLNIQDKKMQPRNTHSSKRHKV